MARMPTPIPTTFASSVASGHGLLLVRGRRSTRAARALSLGTPGGRSGTAIHSSRQPAAAELVEQSVNTIRFLAVDAVEKANSGHPGLPMGCAPLGHVLFDEFLRFNPRNPGWFDRDRFVLSAGHGCMLQYALLHLAGYPGVTVSSPTMAPLFTVHSLINRGICCQKYREAVCVRLVLLLPRAVSRPNFGTQPHLPPKKPEANAGLN